MEIYRTIQIQLSYTTKFLIMEYFCSFHRCSELFPKFKLSHTFGITVLHEKEQTNPKKTSLILISRVSKFA